MRIVNFDFPKNGPNCRGKDLNFMKYEKWMSTTIVNCKTVAGSSVAELGLHSGNFGCQAAGCLAALCNVCAALGNVCAAPCNVCAALCNVCAALWGAQKRDGNDNIPTDGKERSANEIGKTVVDICLWHIGRSNTSASKSHWCIP